MEKYFTIVSDGSCDLPEEIVKEKEIGEVHFLVSFDGKEYKKEGVEIRLEDFYGKMVAESNVFPLTAAPSPNDYYEVFKEKAKEGKDILCICISTKLSSSMQSAEIAAKMLAEKYPDIQVKIIDSLACTLMQGLYVLEACRLRDLGYTLKDSIERMNQLTDTQRIFFTVGNLEYLGLRLDLGYNLVSILSLVGFLMVLYAISYRMFFSSWAGVCSLLFFFFRSGTAFWRYLWENIRTGNLIQALTENTVFIGYTTNENWGLWNFNVYLNQRHLAFGLLIVAVAIWIFMDWVEAGSVRKEKGILWIRNCFFTREAWICRNVDTAILMGLFLGLTAFWNGAALIGGLLILAGFAVFSDGKLDYAICAALAVFFSELQSKLFVSGSVMSPSLYWGFLADHATVTGVLWYLAQISGFFFIGLVVVAVFLKRSERVILGGFLLPMLFAFLISLTPDINVNHKYVMISYAFVTVFWGWVVRNIFLSGKTKWKKWSCKVACAILCICLIGTGVYDFVVILLDNDSAHRMTVDMESSLTDWLSSNLKKNDLLLTPEYTMNEVTMSGVMLYCGWPYYAWSAGYDTNYRAGQAVMIYTTDDPQVLKTTVKKEKITYILFEEDMEFEQQECREDIIKKTYPLVYKSEDGRIRVYET